jgi:hypothetical protein
MISTQPHTRAHISPAAISHKNDQVENPLLIPDSQLVVARPLSLRASQKLPLYEDSYFEVSVRIPGRNFGASLQVTYHQENVSVRIFRECQRVQEYACPALCQAVQ